MLQNKLELKGTWLAIISGLLYGLLGFFGVSLMKTGLSIYNLSFWRFLVSAIFLLILIIAKRKRDLGRARQLLNVFVNGMVFYSPCGILFFVSSNHIGTGQSMVIFFIYPAFVMLFGWAWEKKKINKAYFWSFALIIGGLILLVDIKELSYDLFGISLSLISAISYAAYVFLSKKIALSPLSSTLMVSLGCAMIGLVLAIVDNSLTIPNTTSQWLYILAIGIICSAWPILLLLEALKYISADKASLLSVLEPVFTVIFGIILLSEEVTIIKILGILLILLGAMSITIKKGFPT